MAIADDFNKLTSASARGLSVRAPADVASNTSERKRQPRLCRIGDPTRRSIAGTADHCRQRRQVAEMCRLMGWVKLGQQAGATDVENSEPFAATAAMTAPSASHPCSTPDAGAALATRLSPRVRQTLGRLLLGDSEKQIAHRLKLSTHTIHVYVKTLYRKLNVSSRGELLAKFVSPSSVSAAVESNSSS